MNLPNVINNFIAAQNNFDSEAYTECFTTDAIVHDEGKTHTGKHEIKEWNEKSIAAYKAQIKTIDFTSDGKTALLIAEISGTFDGSPITLKFQFEIKDDKIAALTISNA